MSRRAALRTSSQLLRQTPVAPRRNPFQIRALNSAVRPSYNARATPARLALRGFHNTSSARIELLDDAAKETPKESEPHDLVKEPTPLTDEEYHERSDKYFEALLERLEALHEEKGNMDVEYAVCQNPGGPSTLSTSTH